MHLQALIRPMWKLIESSHSLVIGTLASIGLAENVCHDHKYCLFFLKLKIAILLKETEFCFVWWTQQKIYIH